MNNVAWHLEHSVEADVTPSFAWAWRTDVRNWDDPPAQFRLDGAFAPGSWGATVFPGQEPLPTQRIVLSGEHATRYADQVRDGFGSTLADGMKRIADAMANAES